MSRIRSILRCQQCGHASAAWMGRCPECGAWNSFVEEQEVVSPGGKKSGRASEKVQPVRLAEIKPSAAGRMRTGTSEFDRVLGGGIIPGSVVLLAGDPGIGKSTLILQVMEALAAHGEMLYVSAEESPEQIKLRADRMDVSSGNLLILPATTVEEILDAAGRMTPSLLTVDSIQTIHAESIQSAPGSVGQVRESAARLTHYAKTTGVPVVIIGHVTKDGAIAGPKVLEHIVDTVIHFEGDRGRSFRILRAVKNRFGSTNEIGVFTMTGRGLSPVDNPSELFLAEHSLHVPGSVVSASLEGTRPLVVEIQALVSPSSLGTPRRTALGIDTGRAALLLAVLEKRAGLPLSGRDVYLNVVGGLRLDDTAIDLGIAVAAASSLADRPVPSDTVLFGEIGLSGELRAVAQAEARVKEAAKLGFRRVILPSGNLKRMAESKDRHGLALVGLSSLMEAVETIFPP